MREKKPKRCVVNPQFMRCRQEFLQEYHQYVSRHAGICHPNILQIFGVSNFSCKYAVIVQDDLLPYDVYLSLQRSSFILEIYLYAYWSTEFRDALKYILDCKGWTFWIRRLSGRLCIEIESSHINEPWLVDIDSVYDPRLLGYGGLAQLDWNNPKWDSTAVEFFTISQFHRIFGANLFNLEDIPADQDPADEVHLGTILLAPGDSEEVYEVAYLPAIKDNLSVWQCIQPGCRADIMDNGWTRFNSWDIYGEQISFHLSIGNTHQPLVGDIWIAQANHVFEQLRVTSGHNNYVFTYAVEFRSQNLLTSTSDPPHGYLFLCPLDHFQTGRNSFRLPDVFWFWSIDPTGQNFATEDQAVILGFPELRMQCPTYQGYCWDTRAYEGLAAFHAAKGFNPKSQDLAIHLGLPLYELCDPR
ncbi:hypothetical protein FB45DRAFT_921495 [Roridomyces roridus]|uniref:Uncharacterized protein n=1 Tax=Roridomyces roridus TaxID=1738132 RepID=A0AAD7BQD7_9AGAR|nr:hypothetical protein FB45DRAFT_921495 [Roridomyces roridus]